MKAPDLTGRVVLVTGASRGFGREIAKGLAAAGAHLVLVARTVGALEALDDELQAAGHQPATLAPLDLRDDETIESLGQALFQRWGRLDGLVHAAGELGVLSPVAHLEPKVLADTMALSVNASHRLIRSVDPLLRAAPAGRAVFVTCRTGRPGKAFWGAVAAPRAALEALVKAYAAETRRTSVLVNLFDPGPLRTRLRSLAYPGEPPDAVPHPADPVPTLVQLLGSDYDVTGELVHWTPDAV